MDIMKEMVLWLPIPLGHFQYAKEPNDYKPHWKIGI
jgi:hypothetical protein